MGLPHYSALRIDIGVRIPCVDSPEARDAAYEEALAFLTPKFVERTDEGVAYALEQERKRSGG